MDEVRIDNALIGQATQLRLDVNAGSLSHVLTVLYHNRTLWKVLNYSYKGCEITAAAAKKATAMIDDLAPQAHRKRAELEALRGAFWSLNGDYCADERERLFA